MFKLRGKHTIMVFELFEETAGPVIEEVNGAIVERGEDPGTVLVEGEAFNSLAFGFELCFQHIFNCNEFSTFDFIIFIN